ncbi:hypothetical protein XENOCAPTIV_007164, partial [Xenoophorus captivus]
NTVIKACLTMDARPVDAADVCAYSGNNTVIKACLTMDAGPVDAADVCAYSRSHGNSLRSTDMSFGRSSFPSAYHSYNDMMAELCLRCMPLICWLLKVFWAVMVFIFAKHNCYREDCVSLVDGHKILSTLQDINSLLDNGPTEEIITQVWAFVRSDAQLSRDFIQGTKDFSDTSFIRSIDFSKPEEAETLVNSFVEKTSDRKVKNIFKDLNPRNNLIFISSFRFKGLCSGFQL